MTDSTSRLAVTAEWTYIGEVPGASRDLGIAAMSEAILQTGELADFAMSFVAGVPNPSHDSHAPSAPPWVTIGTHDSAGTRYISVAVQLPWEGIDQRGRPIWPRNFFVFRYDEVAAHDLSYETLWQAVREVRLPTADRRPVQLQPAPRRVGELEPVIARYGFERLAAIAAALLDAPVAVGGAAELRLAGRLQLLDAIAALLPRGFYADLSASSAVSGLNVPNMRLILTDEEDDRHQQLSLNGDLSWSPSPGVHEYHQALVRKVELLGLPPVLEFLWAQSEPLSFTSAMAEKVLGGLDRLNREPELANRARNPGSIDLSFTLDYFAEPNNYLGCNWDSLPSASREKFLVVLLGTEREDTTAALSKTLAIVFRDLTALVINDLAHGGTALAERGLRAAVSAGQDKFADVYLDYILIPALVHAPEESWPALIRPRVEVLLAVDVPRQGELAGTRRRLRYGPENGWQARLVRALFIAELATKETTPRVRAWALWLFGSTVPEDEYPADWLTALDFIVGQSGPLGAAARAINELTRADLGWVPLLALVADAFDRLPDTLEVLANGLIRCALERSDAEALKTVLDLPFRQAGVVEVDLAWIDGARVLVGLGPRHVPDPAHTDLFTQYVAGLDGLLHSLVGTPESHDLIQRRFLEQVLRERHRASPLPPAVIRLIKAWARDQTKAPVLARYIHQSRAGDVLLSYNQLAPEDWAALAVYFPSFRPLASMGSLSNAIRRVIDDPPGQLSRETLEFTDDQGTVRVSVCASVLAGAIFHAWASGMSAGQILTVMRSVRHCRTATDKELTFTGAVSSEEFWGVLREFQSLLRDLSPDSRAEDPEGGNQMANAEDIWIEFLDLIIIEQILGSAYAAKFQGAVVGKFDQETAIHGRLRQRFGRPRNHLSHALFRRYGSSTGVAWRDVDGLSRP